MLQTIQLPQQLATVAIDIQCKPLILHVSIFILNSYVALTKLESIMLRIISIGCAFWHFLKFQPISQLRMPPSIDYTMLALSSVTDNIKKFLNLITIMTFAICSLLLLNIMYSIAIFSVEDTLQLVSSQLCIIWYVSSEQQGLT